MYLLDLGPKLLDCLTDAWQVIELGFLFGILLNTFYHTKALCVLNLMHPSHSHNESPK